MKLARNLGAAGLVFATFGMVGCSPVMHGQVGLTVDAQGRPVGIVRMCEDYKADEFRLVDGGDTTASPTVWKPQAPLGHTIRISLIGTPNPTVWKSPTNELISLDPSAEYQFSGGEHDRSALIGRVHFTTEDLVNLTPEKVFMGRYSKDDGGRADNGKESDVVSLDEFESFDCG